MTRFNKNAYVKGMYLYGAVFSDDGTVVGVERKPAPPQDPRVAFLRKRTASLNEISAKLDALKPQIDALAAKVRRP